MEIKKVKLQEKYDLFSEHWSPKIVGELNGQFVKIVKVKGDFVMHKHENEDELFFVIEGLLFIELEDDTLEIKPGEFVIIPRGLNHKPYAHKETKILMFEPKTTLNTGNTEGEMTVRDLEEI
tara:strand:+ start:1702 stop:2067 length:366 start_codon:yes stop_codon:yes gene_type:complete